MTIEEATSRLVRVVDSEMKGLLQEVDYQAAAAMERYMDDAGPPKGQRSTSSQIGLQSGRLSRSLIPGQADHIAAMRIGGGNYTIEFGTSVPYASIHEHGGTIQHPGGSDFMIIRGRFVPLKAGHPKSFGKTKPHAIEIPARPFMKPGLEWFMKEAFPKLLQKRVERIAGQFNG